MANSYVEYETAGSEANGLGQATFTAPTKFLSINDIRVKGYNGSTWTELTISSRGTTTVTLSAAPTAYSKIRVFRSSTTEALIDFQNGSRLAESDLDTAYRQSLFVAQEVAEVADPDGGSGIGAITNSQLAGGITQDKLAGGITSAQLAGSIADSKLASGVGTSANNLVKLDANAKLPAVDGSQLTNVGVTLIAFDASKIGGSAGGSTGVQIFNHVTTNIGNAYNSSTGRFTAPTAGTYEFTHLGMGAADTGGAGLASGNAVSAYFIKNGTVTATTQYGRVYSYVAASSYPNLSTSVILTLAQGDYVEVTYSAYYMYFDVDIRNNFTGKLIG